MTINDLVKLAIKKLSNSTSPALDGEVLLSHILDKPKEYILSNPNKKVDPKFEKKFRILLSRRVAGWPVAYLQNQKEFFGHKFYVDKNVLIPRPETEGLVELVVKKIKNKKGLKILDIGTGSGNIIIGLAKYLESNVVEPKNGDLMASATKNRYYASDISANAIKVAKKNAKLHKTKMTFRQGHLLEAWQNQKFDVIIANLPYLSRRTDPSTKFEPTVALVAAKKGLALYEELFKQIAFDVIPAKAGIQIKSSVSGSPIRSGMTRKTKFIYLEMGHDQGHQIKKLAKRILPAFETKIFKDLAGRPRFAVLENKAS